MFWTLHSWMMMTTDEDMFLSKKIAGRLPPKRRLLNVAMADRFSFLISRLANRLFQRASGLTG